MSTPWPPPALKRILPMTDMWGAWYSGLPEDLVKFNTSSAPANRPSQYRGGISGALARTWWGQPNTTSTRQKLHMPLPADIAAASADLLFSEELPLTDPTDRLNEILEFNSWQSLLPESGEFCSAFGGVYLRIGWDLAVGPYPILSVIPQGGTLPVFSGGHLKQVTFWTVLNPDDASAKVVRLFETHTVGRIDYRIYEGSVQELGRRVPLANVKGQEELASSVDANEGVDTGIDELTVVYVPNVRPAPMWYNDPVGRYLGRADISGSEPFLDSIDETWSSWMRDIRHGKSRIIVPRPFMEQGKAGDPLWFNMEQDLFVPANTGGQLDVPLKDQLSVQQFTIRTAEHEATLKNLIGVVTRRAGYSSSTFDMVDEAAPTATEVNSRDARSKSTREKKTRYWTVALESVLRILQKVDQQVFKQEGPDEAHPVKVTFPPSDSQSPAELAQTVQLLDAARAVSLKVKVEMLHPDWEEKDVLAEVDQITNESKASLIV